VTIPCIKGTFETLSWILQPYGIHVALKTTTMLQHVLTKVKGRDEPNNKEQFTWSKALTARLPTLVRLAETLTQSWLNTKWATRNGDANNHIASHHQLTNHNIDWDTAQCLTCSTNYFQRLTLENWYTNFTQTPLNRCQPLSARCKRLIHNVNKNRQMDF